MELLRSAAPCPAGTCRRGAALCSRLGSYPAPHGSCFLRPNRNCSGSVVSQSRFCSVLLETVYFVMPFTPHLGGLSGTPERGMGCLVRGLSGLQGLDTCPRSSGNPEAAPGPYRLLCGSGRERGSGRETLVGLPLTLGPDPQPRHAPGPGIRPGTWLGALRSAGRRPAHLSAPSQGLTDLAGRPGFMIASLCLAV